MDSIDPDKFGVEKSSGSGTKIALRDYHEYTTEVGYNYSRTSKITPLSGGAALYGYWNQCRTITVIKYQLTRQNHILNH